MRNLSVGLVGLGMMGKNHARILSSLDSVDFLGIVDPLKSNVHLEKTYGAYLFKDLDELLMKKPDYCVIATPTGSHEEIAIKVLAAGSNCLIEKPVSTNLESAMRIRDLALKKSLVVGIGHVERYNSAVQQAKLKMINNEIGQIYQISFRRQGPFPSRIGDVGVVRDLATHDIDLSMWLTESKFSSIFAHTINRSGRDYEDMVSINGKLQNGVIINMLVNWLSPLKERKVIITGERGVLLIDTLTSDLTMYSNGKYKITNDYLSHFQGVTQGDITGFAFDKPEPLLVEHENFRDHLLNKTANIVSIEDGIETVKISDAVIKSGIDGKRVEF